MTTTAFVPEAGSDAPPREPADYPSVGAGQPKGGLRPGLGRTSVPAAELQASGDGLPGTASVKRIRALVKTFVPEAVLHQRDALHICTRWLVPADGRGCP